MGADTFPIPSKDPEDSFTARQFDPSAPYPLIWR